MRNKLLRVLRKLDTDFKPFGKADPAESDCGAGCRHLLGFTGEVGCEWGVCTNPASPRSGLLTFVHQGCAAFEPMLLDRTLSDEQLRRIIGEASELLNIRRCERVEIASAEDAKVPGQQGEYTYDVRTSYFPRIKGHLPIIYRLEPHEKGFVAVPLDARTRGSERPLVMGRFPARNGDVFKIVRENGEFSYQVPFDGKLYNLKQHGHLSGISIKSLEVLRRFMESVEPDVFDAVMTNAQLRLSHCKKSLEETEAELARWRKNEFWGDEAPKSKRELREMLRHAEELVKSLPHSAIEEQAFIEWLKSINRSAPTLHSVPPPPPSQKRVKL